MTVLTIPKTMRAARYHGGGKPLSIDTVETPSPQATDVVVEIKACGLVPNTANTLEPNPVISGPALPAIYGLDPAGVVVETGPQVQGFAVGDRVYVNPLRYCGTCRPCRTGRALSCDYAILNGYLGTGPKAAEMFAEYPDGGYAEYLRAPQYSLVKLPDEVSFETAARWGYLGTGYSALRRTKVGPSTTVLINGISGTLGLGTALFALALGAPTILGVGRNAERLARVKALAPHRIHVHSAEEAASVSDWARGLTGGNGADVVVDALAANSGVDSFLAAAEALARGGTHVNISGMLDDVAISLPRTMINNQSYIGSFWFTTAEGQEMADLAGVGAVDLSVFEHEVYGIEDIDAAIAAVGSDARNGGFSNYVIVP